MVIKLPKRGRPLCVRYKECELGLDLPAQFMYDLRGVDDNLYPIFHRYQILWDSMVNSYLGELDDPRYPIAENSFRLGELVMGHVLTNGKGIPTPDGHWHIWRWCEPARAWAHVINVDSTDELYLRLLVKRLWLQAKFNDKFGFRGYQRMMEEADLEQRAKLQDEKQDLMKEINKANSGMMSRAMSNFEYGRTAPTNPMHESVMSYPGQKNKSKVVRPMTDEEGGFVLPAEYEHE